MKPEYKSFAFELKNADEDSGTGIIEGYASTFGNIDLGDDIVEKGAFKKTLRENKGRVPILDSHDPSRQIGWNIEAEETDKGLWVKGQLDLNTQGGKERYSLAKTAASIGAKMGLSIGYMTIKAEPDKERPAVRRLKELKLFEYSVVTFPMNTMAWITAAKSFNEGGARETIDEVVASAIEHMKNQGFTLAEIKSALHKGAAAHLIDPARIGQSIDGLIKILNQQ